jgi:chitinase
MNANALRVVDAVLGAGVDLAGVNLMTMDFGGGVGGDMLGTVEQALNAAHDQISAAYAHARIGLNSRHVWNHMGVTVMIGQNDIAGERFAVADAQALVTFASTQGMARLSEWSLNRDTQCGADFAQIGVLSNTCSGVAQQRPLQFTEVFGQVSGDAAVAAGVVTTPDPLTTPAPAVTQDDPATSPYPIWRPQGMYRAGYKVVWRGEVYVAKWYSQNFAPDTPGQLSWQTPWQLVGPVLPGDRPLSVPTLATGTYPAWTATGSYPQGTKVLYQGLPYQARYFTSGSAPDEYQTDSSESAWTPLFQIPGEPY